MNTVYLTLTESARKCNTTNYTSFQPCSHPNAIMGGGSSVPESLWTVEEKEEIEKAKLLQKSGLEFVKRDIFNDIPIRSGRKSADPTAALWIEPIPIDPLHGGDVDGPQKVTEV